jgi:thiamine phosphate synthase YjbQ (UPF0047 family)
MMDFPTELISLSREELIALVQQLRQQLTDREQELARLKSLAAQSTFSAETSALASTEPEPGSQEDLLMQLEKIYPEGE